MRSLVWYSTSLRKTQPKSNSGRSMRNSAGKTKNFSRITGRSRPLPCVDARGAAGGEVGSLAERATAAAPPERHPLGVNSAGGEGTGRVHPKLYKKLNGDESLD